MYDTCHSEIKELEPTNLNLTPKEALEGLMSLFEIPVPIVGLDLDCLATNPEFFYHFSECWPGIVCVVACRKDRAQAEHELDEYGVEYADLILVDSPEAKAKVIAEKGIGVYVTGDEVLQHLPATKTVLKVCSGRQGET